MRDPHEPVRRDVIPRRTHTTIITQNLNRVNTPKRYAINYEETYSGTFTVELDDDSTEQDAINELLDNAYEYRLGEQVELSDSDAQVIKTENVEG